MTCLRLLVSWSSVSDVNRVAYRARQYVQRHMQFLGALLPKGYRKPRTQFTRGYALAAWRDPHRLNVVFATRSGQPYLVSFWPEELGEVLGLRSFESAEFRLDPSLTTRDLALLSRRGYVPKSWLRERFK